MAQELYGSRMGLALLITGIVQGALLRPDLWSRSRCVISLALAERCAEIADVATKTGPSDKRAIGAICSAKIISNSVAVITAKCMGSHRLRG